MFRMSVADDIKQLFGDVYESQKKTFNVQESKIRQSVGNIGHGYRPDPDWKENEESNTPSYEEPSQRCAYLHKYAMLHTAMTYDFLDLASRIHHVNSIIEAKKSLNLCSLGSGPGTDIVAILFFLQDKFDVKQCKANLVDQSIEWKGVFESVVSELRSPRYNVTEMVSKTNFEFRYLKADLLNISEREVFEIIHDADIITMVKFISAAACKDTSKMLKNIFKAMKSGALLLFIDNAGGKFCETLEEIASPYGLESVFKTENHYKYEEPEFNIVKLGITSQFQSTVVAEMWEKVSSTKSNDWKAQSNHDEIDSLMAQIHYDEENYPVIQCAITNQNFKRHNQGFYNSAKYTVSSKEGNIRLQDDSLLNKKDEIPQCCVVM